MFINSKKTAGLTAVLMFFFQTFSFASMDMTAAPEPSAPSQTKSVPSAPAAPVNSPAPSASAGMADMTAQFMIQNPLTPANTSAKLSESIPSASPSAGAVLNLNTSMSETIVKTTMPANISSPAPSAEIVTAPVEVPSAAPLNYQNGTSVSSYQDPSNTFIDATSSVFDDPNKPALILPDNDSSSSYPGYADDSALYTIPDSGFSDSSAPEPSPSATPTENLEDGTQFVALQLTKEEIKQQIADEKKQIQDAADAALKKLQDIKDDLVALKKTVLNGKITAASAKAFIDSLNLQIKAKNDDSVIQQGIINLANIQLANGGLNNAARMAIQKQKDDAEAAMTANNTEIASLNSQLAAVQVIIAPKLGGGLARDTLASMIQVSILNINKLIQDIKSSTTDARLNNTAFRTSMLNFDWDAPVDGVKNNFEFQQKLVKGLIK